MRRYFKLLFSIIPCLLGQGCTVDYFHYYSCEGIEFLGDESQNSPIKIAVNGENVRIVSSGIVKNFVIGHELINYGTLQKSSNSTLIINYGKDWPFPNGLINLSECTIYPYGN